MPLSNVEIRRLGRFAIVTIFALRAFGRVFGFAGPLIAMAASAMLLLALRTLRARQSGRGSNAGCK